MKMNPQAWQLRLFALSWSLLACWGAFALRRCCPDSTLWLVMACFSGGLACGMIQPVFLVWPYRLVEKILSPVGATFSWLIFGLVYFGIFTPFALILKLRGWDPLRRRSVIPGSSGWIRRPEGRQENRFYWQS